ncbi:MAG: hypothetical protein U0521_12970 [Anaerolineae bacterium]
MRHGLLRVVLPPQADNEQAADYLRTRIGKNGGVIEWAAVRSRLIDRCKRSDRVRRVPFTDQKPDLQPGKTSRINVGHYGGADYR